MAKSKEQLQTEAEIARKKAVDDKNRKAEAENKAKLAKLADIPLTEEERAFCLNVGAKMNKGRRTEKPCSSHILRYSKLKPRMDIVAKVEDKE